MSNQSVDLDDAIFNPFDKRSAKRPQKRKSMRKMNFADFYNMNREKLNEIKETVK